MLKRIEENMQFRPPISAQALAILKLLAKSCQPFMATQIAKQLNIKPQAAHRSLVILLHLGLVRSVILMPGTAKPAFYLCQTYNLTKLKYMKRMEKDFDEWFGETLRNSHANRIYNT
jgi:predicted transcriptional regulator